MFWPLIGCGVKGRTALAGPRAMPGFDPEQMHMLEVDHYLFIE